MVLRPVVRLSAFIKPFQIRYCLRHASTKASHTDITSFLKHATSKNLSTTSTYFVGTLYEYTVLHALRKFNICLHRTGGTDDHGVDLRGRWLLPTHTDYSDGIPVVVQCKAEKRPLGPKYLRELEGATASEEIGTLLLLATLSRFTEGARRAVMGSDMAMGVVVVGGFDTGGEVRQFIWNGAAGRLLSYELGVKAVFGPGDQGKANEEAMETWVVLTWNGSVMKTRKDTPGAI
jgi:Protein of unknown function (DUF2034)